MNIFTEWFRDLSGLTDKDEEIAKLKWELRLAEHNHKAVSGERYNLQDRVRVKDAQISLLLENLRAMDALALQLHEAYGQEHARKFVMALYEAAIIRRKAESDRVGQLMLGEIKQAHLG